MSRGNKSQDKKSPVNLRTYGRSPNEKKSGLSHSVIRGLDTDRLMTTPKALRSKLVDHRKGAVIESTQIAKEPSLNELLADALRKV